LGQGGIARQDWRETQAKIRAEDAGEGAARAAVEALEQILRHVDAAG